MVELADGSTGQATPSRNLLKSWGTRGRVESPTGCQPLDCSRPCRDFRSIYGASSRAILNSILTPDDSETDCLPLLILRIFIPSLAYRHLLATLYASTLRPSKRRIALTYHIHDPKIMSTSPTPSSNHPSHIYTPGFLYYYERDLAATFHGWFNSFQHFCHSPQSVLRIAFRYTCATWMLAMIYLWDWASAVT